jgi:hypothetical protein
VLATGSLQIPQRAPLNTLLNRSVVQLISIFSLMFLFTFSSANVNAALDDEVESDEQDIDAVAQAAEMARHAKNLRKEEVFARVVGKPVLDGDTTDDFWQQANHYTLDYEFYPTRFAPAAVETQAWVAVGDGYIYIAFLAFDPKPSAIRSTLRDRDGVKDGDYVSLIIDPTGKLAKKYEFRVNPDGSTADILQDTASDRYIYDWNAQWKAASKKLPNGYSVEVAIPFASISFPEFDNQKKAQWIIALKRTYPRRTDSVFGTAFQVVKAAHLEATGKKHSATEPPEAIEQKNIKSNDSALNENAGAPQKQQWYGSVTPHYVYNPSEERSATNNFEQDDDIDLNSVGANFKLNIGRAQNILLAINPSFTEVESDIVRDSINNAFVRQQPEKRPLFMPGVELYSTMIPLVYTRNIIRPRAGFAYNYSASNRAAGVLIADDRETELVMPDNLGSETVETNSSSRTAAFRYQQMFDKQSIGLVSTFRSGDEYQNAVLGLDALHNVGIDDKLRYQLVVSDTRYPQRFAEDLCEDDGCLESPPPTDCELGNCPINPYILRATGEDLQGYAARLNYKHDGPSNLYWINYYDVSEDFRADFGFLSRIDVRAVNAAYGKKWYVDALKSDRGKSRIRAYGVYQRIESQSGELIEDGYKLLAEFRGSYQTTFRFGPSIRDRVVNRVDQSTLELDGNAPKFSEKYLLWYFETSPINKWIFNFDGRYGDIADSENNLPGKIWEYKPKLRWQSSRLEVMASATIRDYEVDNGKLYDEQFLTLRVNYRPNNIAMHRLLLLENTTDRNLVNWLVDEVDFERERIVEYTYIREISKGWSFLAGAQFLLESSDSTHSVDLAEREVYVRVSKQLDFSL